MKVVLNWRKRAVIVLAGSLVLLGIILAIFALREAEREKLIREKEIEDEQQRLAELLINQVTAVISEAEERIIRQVQSSRATSQEKEFTELCRRIAGEEEIVNEIFLLSKNGEIIFPLGKPLFSLSKEAQEAKVTRIPIETNFLFQEAEASEFKTKNYSQAIEAYQRLMSTAPDHGSRALLLNCLGRCYEKSGEDSKALEVFQKISNEYSDEVSLEGIPIRLIAQHQIGNLNWKMDRKINGIEAFLGLYSNLLESRWPLSRAQFYFYRNKVNAVIETSLADISGTKERDVILEKWEELKRLEEKKLARMNVLDNIMTTFVPLIGTRKSASSRPAGFYHLSETIGEETYLVSYAIVDENLVFGLRLDSSILAGKLLPPIFSKLPLRKDWHVRIEDERGKTVAGEDLTLLQSPLPQLTLSRRFEDDFPPWKTSIYQTDPGSVKRQFNLRRNIYILSALAAIAALFFGGFLAIRSTARELELAKLKSDFVSTVSHEFRTPLTSIRYLAEMLQRGRVKGEDKKQKYYETITAEGERLSRLIENVLDFSKIEAGMKEYKFEEVDLAEWAGDIAVRFQEQVAPQEFVINSEISEPMPKVIVDREALSRALFNLLDNAAKYSGASRNIYFRAWAERENVFLEVRDEGIGISKEDQKKVFEKFYRAHSVHDSNIKGSGLGLTVVDHIVKAHGGEILIESEVGKGTKVMIKIPAKQEVS